MPKKSIFDKEEYIVSETGNWNVAEKYSDQKIMRFLSMADFYAEMAFFGYSELIDEIMLEGKEKDYLKIIGFRRLVRCLITLIENSLFAIKKEKENVETYKKTLLKIEKSIPFLYQGDLEKKKVKIVGENYSVLLENVLEIKSQINYPLNKSHLIFTDKEEFDPTSFKKALKERIINKG